MRGAVPALSWIAACWLPFEPTLRIVKPGKCKCNHQTCKKNADMTFTVWGIIIHERASCQADIVPISHLQLVCQEGLQVLQ